MNLLAASGMGGVGFWVIYIVVIIAFMYFIAIRPQKKQQKQHQQLINSMEIGDSVQTTDDMVIVEFGGNKNCRIPMVKTAITRVEKAEENNA